MNGVVEFDVEDFKKTHPEMNNVNDDILSSLFGNACLLLDNTENSRVQDLFQSTLPAWGATCQRHHTDRTQG